MGAAYRQRLVGEGPRLQRGLLPSTADTVAASSSLATASYRGPTDAHTDRHANSKRIGDHDADAQRLCNPNANAGPDGDADATAASNSNPDGSGAMTLRRVGMGQALVEFVLIAPVLFLLLGGIITLGIGVFVQQQVTNAAREAARYAAIHSETSQCPTISNREPHSSMLPPDTEDNDCDPPHLRWPEMTSHARGHVFGMDRSNVHISACWSGYWDGASGWDAAPMNASGSPNEFRSCTIGGIDPRTNRDAIGCPAPLTTESDDQASALAHSGVATANQVTVYACYIWHPPFISDLIGGPMTMQAVVTEAMQHQK